MPKLRIEECAAKRQARIDSGSGQMGKKRGLGLNNLRVAQTLTFHSEIILILYFFFPLFHLEIVRENVVEMPTCILSCLYFPTQKSAICNKLGQLPSPYKSQKPQNVWNMPVQSGRGFTSLVHCDIIYKFVTFILQSLNVYLLKHFKSHFRGVVTLAFESVDEIVILQIKPFWHKFCMVPLFRGIF